MTLKVHHLRPAPGAHTPKTRVGRGEGSKGKTAGRGTKGSGARGNTRAHDGAVGGYVNEVEAQRGKAIAGPDADTLIALARSL